MLMINEERQLIYNINVLCAVKIEVIFSNNLTINTIPFEHLKALWESILSAVDADLKP